MKIKICGITRREDLLMGQRIGADLLGFINIERSPRNLELRKIRKLSDEAGEKAVLVLEPSDPQDVPAAVEKTGITRIQLHSVSASDLNRIKGILHDEGIMAEITVAVSPERDSFKDILELTRKSSGILLDSAIKGRTGGTGRRLRESAALKLLDEIRRRNPAVRVTLAGGLTPEFVKNRMAYVSRFDCLDFNSCIERAPGIKDHGRMIQLMDVIRNVRTDPVGNE